MDRLKEILIGMGIDEKSIPEPSIIDTGTDTIREKDADTFATQQGDIRIGGINTRETAKFLPGNIKGSQAGADIQSRLIADMVKNEGFNQPILTGKKDPFNRELGDLLSGGKSLANEALYRGYTDLYKESTDTQRLNEAYGKLDRRERERNLNLTKADELYYGLIGEMYPNERVFAKMYAPTAKAFNQADFDYFVGPAVQRPDEDERGYTKGTISTGLNIGYQTAKQGLFGTLEMIGDTTGSQWLKDIGTSNVRRLQDDLEQLPYLQNPEAFDENGDWKLDTIGKTANFLLGQAAVSAPQMLATVVSTLAAPATGGLTMSLPAGIYIGQTWNGQDKNNKNALAATISGLTQTALDSLSLGFMFKGGMDITKASTQALVKAELAKKGIVGAAADEAIKNSLKSATKEVGEALRIATIRSTMGPKAIAKATVTGTATEGITEGLQEFAGYLGEEVTLSLPKTQEEQIKLKNRVLNAAVGGGLLGGVMSGSSTAIATATNRISPTEVSSDAEFRAKMQRETGTTDVPSAMEIQAEANKSLDEVPSINKQAEMEESKRRTEGVFAKTGSWWMDKGLRSTYGKYSGTIMKGKEHVDKYMAALSTLLGYGRPVNGRSIDEHQALLAANVFSNFGTKEEMLGNFAGLNEVQINNLFNDPKVVESMERISANLNLYQDQTAEQIAEGLGVDFGRYNDQKSALVKYAGKINKLIKSYNSATGENLTFKSFMEQSPIDKTAVTRHYKEFIKDLELGLGVSSAEANQIVDSLLNNRDNSSIDDVFDSDINPFLDLGPGLKDYDTLKSKLNDPENKARFAKYLSNDVLNNAYSMAGRAAAINTNSNLIGKDGVKLASLVQASINAGSITPEEASFMAKEIKDYLAMRSGKYHPITNPYAKGGLATLNFLSTIMSLPLAAISSTVEFAQVFRNLNKAQSIKAMHHLVKVSGKEMGAYLKDIGHSVTDKVQLRDVAHRSTLSRAGYLKEGNTAHRIDVMSSYFQNWTEGFFKLTGLTSVTTITRYARFAIATDAINNWLNTVINLEGKYTDQQVNDATDHLIRIGIDVGFMTSLDRNNEYNQSKFNSNMQLGVYNFVNEAVVMPTQLNRPKFYSDPYLSLFTQFQGYTSAFTANILPRLIGDLGKAGSADQKNAAATIAMMFALSVLAIYLKDLIKYGESPPEWMKSEKQFQRIIGQMGVLGTGQRIWDSIDPLIPQSDRNRGIVAQAIKNVVDQSPQLSLINKVDNVLSAPEGKRIEKGARLLPIVGTSPAFAKYLQKELGD